MTDDRYLYDPFAPRPPANALVGAVAPPEVHDNTEDAGDEQERDLEDMKHLELVELAKRYDLPAYGTKAEIAARIRNRA